MIGVRKICLGLMLAQLSCAGACEVTTHSQVPSHVAEFAMSPSDYDVLLQELDKVGESFQLRRFGAAPGLPELKGRKVLYAVYKLDRHAWRAALDLTDIKAEGLVTLALYGDFFGDSDARNEFIQDVSRVIAAFGGKLTTK